MTNNRRPQPLWPPLPPYPILVHGGGGGRHRNRPPATRIGRSPSPKVLGTDPASHDFIRKSDLAGWRTRSLYPCVRGGTGKAFLPVLKLRGLPYFCTGRHIASWFGDWASAILNLMLIPDVHPFNTGFAIVTMASSQAAYGAWKTLHREPITNRRFVEVFGLVPPHCPLIKRNGESSAPTTDEAPSVGARVCSFCGALLSCHGDGGLSSVACSRLAKFTLGITSSSFSGLMPVGYLQVPALLYTDTSSTCQEEVAEFMPLEWEMRNPEEAAIYRQHLAAFEGTKPERGSALLPTSSPPSSVNDLFDLSVAENLVGVFGLMNQISPYPFTSNMKEAATSQYFFELDRIQGYDVRTLLIEIVCILAYLSRPVSLVAIGNRLSTRARAYLFVIETKLQTILERFPDLFVIQMASPSSLRVHLNLNGPPLANAADGSIYSLCQAVYETPALNLSRKSRRVRTRAEGRRTRRAPSDQQQRSPSSVRHGSSSLFDSRPPSSTLKAVDEEEPGREDPRLLDGEISQREKEILEASIFSSSRGMLIGAGDELAGESTATSTTSGTGVGLQGGGGDLYSPVNVGTPLLHGVGSSGAMGGLDTPTGGSYYETAALKLGRYLSATTSPGCRTTSAGQEQDLLLRRIVTASAGQEDGVRGAGISDEPPQQQSGSHQHMGRFVNDGEEDWFEGPSCGGSPTSGGRNWEALLEPLDLKRSVTEQPPAVPWETNTRSWEHHGVTPLADLVESVCPYSPCIDSVELETLYRSITSPHYGGEEGRPPLD